MKKIILIILLFTSVCYGQSYVSGSGNYDGDAQILFSNMTVEPSRERKLAISNFYSRLKDSLSISSLYDKFDMFYVFSAFDSNSAKLNWAKNGTDNPLTNKQMVFAVDSGFTGGVSGKYLETRITVNNLVRYTLNDNSIGIYSNTANNEKGCLMGVYDVVNKTTWIYFAGGKFYYDNGIATNPFIEAYSNVGLFINNRQSATEFEALRNYDSLAGLTTSPTAGLYQFVYFIGGLAGLTLDNSSKQISLCFIGKSVTQTEARKIFNCYQAYLCEIRTGYGFVTIDGNSIVTRTSYAPGFSISLENLLGLEYFCYNKAVPNDSIINMITTYPTEVAPLYNTLTNKNVLVLYEGTNDLFNRKNADSTYKRIKRYCGLAKATGFKVVVCTVLPWGTNANGVDSVNWVALNDSLRTKYATFADILCDVQTDTDIGDWGDQTNTTYYNADKSHLTTTGAAKLATLIYNAIKSISW